MYTLVLMTSLSAAPDAVEFNGFFRRLFSFGGNSCCGGSCSGSGYNSCSGGGSRLRAYSSCCGGTGRGYGSCTGSSQSAGACSGSGFSPCSGGASYSCSGGLSGPMNIDPGLAVPVPATSNFFYPSFYAPPESPGCLGGGFTPNLPTFPPGLGVPAAPPAPAVPPEVSDNPGGRNSSYPVGGARATVVVRLPADAVLYAEGRRLNLAGGERTFTTPPLAAGDWGYTFRAEYTRDGETISRTRRVGVTPGGRADLEFTETGLARTTKLEAAPLPPAQTASVPTVAPPAGVGGPAPATLTIKLPPGATLTVDGKTVRQSGDFRTPPLAPGREYSYQMQTEEMKEGRPVRTASKVSFRAGELVTVDFTAPGK